MNKLGLTYGTTCCILRPDLKSKVCKLLLLLELKPFELPKLYRFAFWALEKSDVYETNYVYRRGQFMA